MGSGGPRAAAGRSGRLRAAAIIAACQTLIRDVLNPEFLPEVRPGDHSCVVDIHAAWHGGRRRCMQRRRSGRAHNGGFGFAVPFARIDRMGPDRLDLYWMRTSCTWLRAHEGVTLAESLRLLEEDLVLHRV